MQKSITGTTVATQARMLSSSGAGVIVLVEGDSDARLFKNFLLSDPAVRVIPCMGKLNVQDALTHLDDEESTCVVGIADADFDRLIGGSTQANLVLTDHHDIESLMICSDALIKVVGEFHRDSDTTNATVNEIRTRAFDAALPLGRIRLWSQKESRNLSFKGIDYDQIASKPESSSPCSLVSLVSEILRVNRLSPASQTELSDIAKSPISDPEPVQDLVNGHDLAEFLVVLVPAQGRSRLSRAKLEQSLRLAYGEALFRKTRLFTELRSWGSEHGVQLF